MHNFVQHDRGNINKTQQVCGIGFAAVNFHVNGAGQTDESWIYMNQTSLKDYVAAIEKNQFPVSRGFKYTYRDVKLAWLFQSMQTMRINHLDYREIFNENLLDEYSAVWNELDKRGWITTTESELQFDGVGQYYIPLLQSLIASKRLEKIRSERKMSLDNIEVVLE